MRASSSKEYNNNLSVNKPLHFQKRNQLKSQAIKNEQKSKTQSLADLKNNELESYDMLSKYDTNSLQTGQKQSMKVRSHLKLLETKRRM